MQVNSARQVTRTLPALNLGKVFKAYNIKGNIGIYDEETGNVWFDYDLHSTKIENLHEYEEVELLNFPSNYGQEKNAVIGGIGRTLRIVGLIKGHADFTRLHGKTHVTIYATNISDETSFQERMDELNVSIEEIENGDDEYGLVASLYCDVSNLHTICANIFRMGSSVFVTDNNVNSFECLGIERLDRRDEEPKRAPENWNYSYLPDDWIGVPTLWSNIALNFVNCDIENIPQPLRQYVAAYRIINEPENTDLLNSINDYKWVSSSLETNQSRQLILANYILNVEKNKDPVQIKLCTNILWRYLIMRGYSSRWLGKYDQNALFLGNGLSIRRFKNLNQYDTSNLTISVLEKVYKKDGTIKGKGSKGSRSKYASIEKRYIPKRRMKTNNNMEDVMKKK